MTGPLEFFLGAALAWLVLHILRITRPFGELYYAREFAWSWNRIIGRWPVRGRLYRIWRWEFSRA